MKKKHSETNIKRLFFLEFFSWAFTLKKTKQTKTNIFSLSDEGEMMRKLMARAFEIGSVDYFILIDGY